MTNLWLLSNALHYPEGGGHLWVYLNWALAMRSIGCHVTWLELVQAPILRPSLADLQATLRQNLAPFGIDDVVIAYDVDDPGWADVEVLDRASQADALLSLRYGAPSAIVDRFPRRAIVDIDPGLLQLWMSQGLINLATYDHYFTIGEHVGKATANFPDAGVRWTFTPPCVDLEHWPPGSAPAGGAFTTVTHWDSGEWVTHGHRSYLNSKRLGFMPFVQLPELTSAPLELAVLLGGDLGALKLLKGHGWRVRDSHEVAGNPLAYRNYVQNSRGEFSAAKPSSSRLNAAWISDRTICYLASGRPAVIQYTGPSSLLPDDLGTIRFRSLEEAVAGIHAVVADYDRHAQAARKLAEERFDGRRVATRVLERLLS